MHEESAAISAYYQGERLELVAFAQRHGPYDATLDIGCAAGVLGHRLQQEGIVSACDGIEPNAKAAGLAQTRLRSVWHGTIESQMKLVPWQQYDLIILADVLEHLADPWSILRQLHANTAPGCRLLLSVPNVRHYKVVLPLLWRGQFRYTDKVSWTVPIYICFHKGMGC